MSEITDDEYTVLMISEQGQSLMAIGRWEKPCDSLVARGLLTRHDKFNHSITNAGRQAVKEREAQDDQALRDVVQKVGDAAATQASIQDFVRQAADLLAQAARAASLVTGDAPAVSAQRWGEVIIQEALTRLR